MLYGCELTYRCEWGGWRLIATDVIDPEESYEYGYIDNDGSDLDEEGDSGSGEVGMRTGVPQLGT